MKQALHSSDTDAIERLLCQAAEWEPLSPPPVDLAHRALRTVVIPRRRTGPVWGVSIAMAAASVGLFAFFHPLSVVQVATEPTATSPHQQGSPIAPLKATLPSAVPTRPASRSATATVASYQPDPSVSGASSSAALEQESGRTEPRHSARRPRRHRRHSRAIPGREQQVPLIAPATTPPQKDEAVLVAEETPVMLIPVMVADQVPTEDGQGMQEVYTPALVAVALSTTGSGVSASPEPSASPQPAPEASPTPIAPSSAP